MAGLVPEPNHLGDQRGQLRCADVLDVRWRGEGGQRYAVGAAVRAHGHRCGGPQHPHLARVVHARQTEHRGRAEVRDLLLAQFDVDAAALGGERS